MQTLKQPLRIGIVAGEPSGDLLGAELIHALRAHYPNAVIEGVGGTQMLAAGFHSHYPLETLSVMGLVEVFKHYIAIKQCFYGLRQHFLQHPPDIFIGIDSPDFNLRLEKALKKAGIRTVHYVSPTVWAWRHYRLRYIANSCNLMLTLFPFEAAYYQQRQIPVQFVGHPLADTIALHSDKLTARRQLRITSSNKLIAMLPGSRQMEVNQLAKPFLQTARWLLARDANLHFIVPLANEHLKTLFTQQVHEIAADLPITLFTGKSQLVMAAADVILTASGTATLEALLFKRPMVVAYRFAKTTYLIGKLLTYLGIINIQHFALPNLLAQQTLVPEFLQHQVTPEALGVAVLHWLEHPEQVEQLQQQFLILHQQLRQNASQQTAKAILSLLTR